MRKITGYIGAIIIVFALMGSILLGYALNVNGTTTTVNGYDPVTDVSGLYTHSQEPAYIDYNPASNYIGYQNGPNTYNNTYSGNTYKTITSGQIVIKISDHNLYIGGVNQGNPNTVLPHFYFICDKYYVYFENASQAFIYRYGAITPATTDIVIDINGTTHNITVNGTTTTITGINTNLYYTTIDPNYAVAMANNKQCMLNNSEQALSLIFNGDYTFRAITKGNTYYEINNNTTGTTPITSQGDYVDYGVYDYTVGKSNSAYNIWGTFYPMAVNSTVDIGINYTESNRVNNYPVIRSDASTTTEVTTLTVGNLSATDYWPEVPSGWLKTGYLIYETQPVYPHDMITAPYWYTGIDLSAYNYGNTMLHQYRLSDVLINYNIPIGTQTLKITTNSNDIRSYTYYNLDANIINFVNASNNTFIQNFNDIAYKKDYLIYDIANNICTVYDYNGVALYTNTPENIGVIFCDNTGADYMRYSHFETVNDLTNGFFVMDSRPIPFITITASIYNPADIDYIDITKGYNIKSTNVANTIWDNEYNNGDIKLLFRAENTSATYHNNIIIGNNTVSVDYSSNRYSITLNSGDPVDIGTWRNIILDIDLINGKLSAIPVKTFNSYTNVELMNTIIPVGDLVNPSPTNTIEWAPTINSLMFNVYSTSVNMNTYGVVMVNPSLNIQDYFTNLNNFYRMNFYNFSTYGNSITINGQTSMVTNGTVTYGGETIRLKDLNITYADGHTYIGDSNLEIDLGETTDYNISMTGAWYFQTMLEKGYTELKNIYEWDWNDFILNNTQFCVIYMGLAFIGLIVARRFCNLSIIDYSVLILSVVIALTVQVVA